LAATTTSRTPSYGDRAAGRAGEALHFVAECAIAAVLDQRRDAVHRAVAVVVGEVGVDDVAGDRQAAFDVRAGRAAQPQREARRHRRAAEAVVHDGEHEQVGVAVAIGVGDAHQGRAHVGLRRGRRAEPRDAAERHAGLEVAAGRQVAAAVAVQGRRAVFADGDEVVAAVAIEVASAHRDRDAQTRHRIVGGLRPRQVAGQRLAAFVEQRDQRARSAAGRRRRRTGRRGDVFGGDEVRTAVAVGVEHGGGARQARRRERRVRRERRTLRGGERETAEEGSERRTHGDRGRAHRPIDTPVACVPPNTPATWS
jgi:hypothetical protein